MVVKPVELQSAAVKPEQKSFILKFSYIWGCSQETKVKSFFQKGNFLEIFLSDISNVYLINLQTQN